MDLTKLHSGLSREDVIRMFGEPDQKGGTSRKYPVPRVFRYGRVDLCFHPWKDGTLVSAYEVDEFGSCVRQLFPSTRSDTPR